MRAMAAQLAPHYRDISLIEELKRLLKDYLVETGSQKAKDLLDNFRVEVRNFWLIKPKNLTKLPLNLENGD